MTIKQQPVVNRPSKRSRSVTPVPKSVGGLLAWFDADDANSITIDTGVSQWDDRGPYGESVVQATGSQQPTYTASEASVGGKPVVTFDGAANQFLKATALHKTVEQPGYVFFVGNVTTVATTQRMFGGGTSTEWLFQYNITSGARLAFAGANLTGSAVEVNTPEIVSIAFEGATDPELRAGGVDDTAAGHPSGGDLIGLTLGKGNSFGQVTGFIAEFLLYDRRPTDEEIQRIEIYLADKWELYHPNAEWIKAYEVPEQVAIHVGKLNKAQVATTASPLALWLDATDASTITLNSTDISQWDDKSPHGNDATQGTSSRQPLYDTTGFEGLACASPDGGDELLVSDDAAFAWDGFAIFMAAERTVDAGANEYFLWKDNGAPEKEMLFVINTSDQLTMVASTDGTATVTENGANTAMALDKAFIIQSYEDGGNLYVKMGEEVSAGKALSGVHDGTDNFSIFSINAAGGFAGNVPEIIIYNESLTSSQRQDIEVYLADKYKLYHPSAVWITNYDTLTQAIIHTGRLNESQINTTESPLNAHFDPMDTSSMTINPSTNQVSQIDDLSPHAHHAVQATQANQGVLEATPTHKDPANSTVLSTNPMIFMESTSGRKYEFTTDVVEGDKYMIFQVVLVDEYTDDDTTGSSLNSSFSLGDATSSSAVAAIRASRTNRDKIEALGMNGGGTLDEPAGLVPALVTMYHDQTDFIGYLNGVEERNDPASVGSTVVTGGFLGGDSTNNRGWTGWFGETIVIHGEANATQRAAIETYLMDKWGIS